MRIVLFSFLGFLACEPVDDTFREETPPAQLSWSDTVITQDGRYQLDLSRDPDPPQLGPFAMTIEIGILNDNPCFSGAALLNAKVRLLGVASEGGQAGLLEVEAIEQGGGAYTANWSFAQGGYWEIVIEVGAGEDTDSAVIGLVVED